MQGAWCQLPVSKCANRLWRSLNFGLSTSFFFTRICPGSTQGNILFKFTFLSSSVKSRYRNQTELLRIYWAWYIPENAALSTSKFSTLQTKLFKTLFYFSMVPKHNNFMDMIRLPLVTASNSVEMWASQLSNCLLSPINVSDKQLMVSLSCKSNFPSKTFILRYQQYVLNFCFKSSPISTLKARLLLGMNVFEREYNQSDYIYIPESDCTASKFLKVYPMKLGSCRLLNLLIPACPLLASSSYLSKFLVSNSLSTLGTYGETAVYKFSQSIPLKKGWAYKKKNN